MSERNRFDSATGHKQPGRQVDANGNPVQATAEKRPQNPSPPAENLLFYDSDPRDIEAATKRTRDFTEYLCAVYPDWADQLPPCWAYHPDLFLMMHSLRLAYDARFQAKDNTAPMSWFLSCLIPANNWLVQWNQNHPEVRGPQGHEHGQSAGLRMRAGLRRQAYRDQDGYEYPGDFWNWPPRSAETETWDPESAKAKGDPVQNVDMDLGIIGCPEPNLRQ